MNCPRCNINLAISLMQGIEIDYCPGCRGVWLDRGELEKIIERSESVSSPYVQKEDHFDHPKKQFDKHHDEHHENYYGNGHHNKRKKGLLSELFDF